MEKKVLVISSSLRANSNSEALADEFIRGATAANHQVEKITLKNKTIHFCLGCLSCQKTGKCVIQDDAIEIAQKMKEADVLVFATPIYYYEMSGQLKTLLDRANSLYSSDYRFRDIYFLSSAAENEEGVDRRAISGIQGWIDCFEHAKFKGSVFAGGVGAPNDIKNHPSLQKAYEMGKQI